jgi:hypothetical protein
VSNHRAILAMISMFLFLFSGLWLSRAIGQVNVDVGGLHVQVGDAPPPEEIEVLTRGPIHEAFAQPVTFDEGEGVIIPRRPPSPILENVPYDKPQGDHIVWIPGYWSWDEDRNDFIWVSGCWRAVPPNASWVPGYWAQSRQGYQWIAGFWTTADAEEIVYLPAPPATLEEGPFGRADSTDSVWIPGSWVRYKGRYAWRSGFWERARPDWVWVPAQYIYTPRGYIHVKGYWDYSFDRRGVAFLPIYCPPSRYGRANFRYSPEIAIDLNGLMLNLFVSRDRRHYYFGDYYGDNDFREGYRPWYKAQDHRRGYDPIFVHEQWRHRNDRQWVDRQRTEYDRRRTNKDMRPARTYKDMRTRDARLSEKDRRRTQFARPMKDVVAEKKTPFRYERLDKKRRKETSDRERDVRTYQDKRSKWESPFAKEKADPNARRVIAPNAPVRTDMKSSKQPAKQRAPMDNTSKSPGRDNVVGGRSAGQNGKAQKVKIPRSPIVVRQPSRDKNLTPPPKPKQPKINPNIQPKTKKNAPDRSRDKDKTKSEKSKSKKSKKK